MSNETHNQEESPTDISSMGSPLGNYLLKKKKENEKFAKEH